MTTRAPAGKSGATGRRFRSPSTPGSFARRWRNTPHYAAEQCPAHCPPRPTFRCLRNRRRLRRNPLAATDFMLRCQRALATFSRLDAPRRDGCRRPAGPDKTRPAAQGERVVIAGSGPLLLAVASTVKRAGGNIVAIIEQAPMTALARFATGLWRWPEKLRQLGELFPARYHPASQVIHAQGDSCLQSVTVRHQTKPRDRLRQAGYRLWTGTEY